jgi:hypothetical protein
VAVCVVGCGLSVGSLAGCSLPATGLWLGLPLRLNPLRLGYLRLCLRVSLRSAAGGAPISDYLHWWLACARAALLCRLFGWLSVWWCVIRVTSLAVSSRSASLRVAIPIDVVWGGVFGKNCIFVAATAGLLGGNTMKFGKRQASEFGNQQPDQYSGNPIDSSRTERLNLRQSGPAQAGIHPALVRLGKDENLELQAHNARIQEHP